MHIDVIDNRHMVIVWLAAHEDQDADLRKRLGHIIADFSAKGYRVCIMISGDGNLFSNTLALLKHNRFVPELETVEIE